MSKFRVLVLTVLAACVGVLWYLCFAGVEDHARGIAGQYALSGPAQQAFVYPSPEFFFRSLSATRVDPSLRRLKFVCPDGSESFTVYRTFFGIFGIPAESVTCADGFKLLNYDPSKGFVIEQR